MRRDDSHTVSFYEEVGESTNKRSEQGWMEMPFRFIQNYERLLIDQLDQSGHCQKNYRMT